MIEKSGLGSLNRLRTAAVAAISLGGAGSVGLMLLAGRHNPSPLLLVLFALWVLSPFALLGSLDVASKRWPTAIRATLYGLAPVITLSTLAIYGDVALNPPRSKTAAVFVVVPPASWLLIAIALSVAALVLRRILRPPSQRFG